MTQPQYQKSLVWFRRDLRDFDHAALHHALTSSSEVYCTFVFDTEILDTLPDKEDRRVEFIHSSLQELKQALQQKGGDLIVLHGLARQEIPKLALRLNAEAVFSNRDYEPAAINRDAEVAKTLARDDIEFHQFKDQVLFEQDEILTQSGKPFSIFTPYKNTVLKKLNDFNLKPYPIDQYTQHLAQHSAPPLATLKEIGFKPTNNPEDLGFLPGMRGGKQLFDDFLDRIDRYKQARDFPAIKGPSYLSVHLRFGTVSIRHLARTARELSNHGAEIWLNELIWREFYFQVLQHAPHIAEGKTFRPEYNEIPFPGGKALFHAWCEARTGYPFIDAAMRQLDQTGYMHNRLRMITASFLVKDLLVDWRWGERYFADKLMDYDFSNNNGGWQWAASTGCDAQPWFRIFNPVMQSQKFDPEGKFIRQYIPELRGCTDKEIHAPWLMQASRQQALGLVIGKDYPAPVVDHATQRQYILSLYKQAQKKEPTCTC